MKKIILLLGLLVLGIGLIAGCKAKKEDSGSAAPAKVEESNVKIISDTLEGITVSAEYPKQLWCAETIPGLSMRIYNVPTIKDVGSDSPQIGIRIEKGSNFDYFDFYKKDFKDLKNLPNKTIGGIDMKGRTYKNVGMEWSEYLGKIDEDHVVSIKISINEDSFVDIENGEGKEIIDSIKFEKAAE